MRRKICHNNSVSFKKEAINIKIERYVGKKLEQFKNEGIRHKPIRIFCLNDRADSTGVPLVEGYTFGQILNQIPAASKAVIEYAEDYYGELILRVHG